MIVSGSLIIAGSILAGWLYWLTGRVQRLLDHAEGAIHLADRTFAALPVPRDRSDGLLRWLGDAPAAGPVPLPAEGTAACRVVPGPRPSPVRRTDTAEMSAALDAGLRRIAQRSTGRHAAARPGGRSGA